MNDNGDFETLVIELTPESSFYVAFIAALLRRLRDHGDTFVVISDSEINELMGAKIISRVPLVDEDGEPIAVELELVEK